MRIGGFFWSFFQFLVTSKSLGLDPDSTKKNLNLIPESSDLQNWREVCIIPNFLAKIPPYKTRDILGFYHF